MFVPFLASLPGLAQAQFTQQGNKLVATGTSFTQQGTSVALSSDGNTAIVGGPRDAGEGGAWVYTRSGAVWAQQGGKLLGTGALTAMQGQAVSISADGNTALVSGSADSNNTGAVWIFTRTGGVWSQQGTKLVGTGFVGTNPYQGYAAALSADGNTAIVGGYGDNGFAGAAWVFVRVGSIWSQQGNKLVGTGGSAAAEQGYAVALSADGNTAIVGGPNDNGGVGGATWVFTRTNRVWSQLGAKLVGTGGVGNQQQGWSVALSADGNTAVVGGYGDNSLAGAAWVFTRSGTVWSQQGNKLVGTGAAGIAHQGTSVSLSGDGNIVISGGNNDNNFAGASWAFTRTGGVWSQLGNKLVGTGAVGNAWQGTSVALSGDGSTAIVGGDHDNSFRGAAWVLVRGSSSVHELSNVEPSSFALEQNYPNPFNPSTNIRFRISDFGFASLKVFDILGREVATLVNEQLKPGSYEATFDAKNLTTGVYYCAFNASGHTQTKKMILVK
jgi:hypothetical protein